MIAHLIGLSSLTCRYKLLALLRSHVVCLLLIQVLIERATLSHKISCFSRGDCRVSEKHDIGLLDERNSISLLVEDHLELIYLA